MENGLLELGGANNLQNTKEAARSTLESVP
jgi:hypothetical protein